MRSRFSQSLAGDHHRGERQLWFSGAIASVLMFAGLLVAIDLRDRQIIGESTLGAVVIALTLTSIFVVGALGFRDRKPHPGPPPGDH
jgi:hypothetical protein